MKASLAILIGIFPSLFLFSQNNSTPPVEALLQRLGSASFADRVAATKALQERPEAESALREALRTSDLEQRRRIEGILDYFERRPLRELHAAAKEGEIERIVDLLSGLPARKYDEEVWQELRSFGRALLKRHEKKGGARVKSGLSVFGEEAPVFLRMNRFTEQIRSDCLQSNLIVAREVDYEFRRNMKERRLDHDTMVVCKGSVRMAGELLVIFATGSVEILNCGLDHSLIVSGGDVTLNCITYSSVIIARGNIVAKDSCAGNRIVAGKSFQFDRARKPVDCLISENDTNPLGYIRWSTAPKGKERNR